MREDTTHKHTVENTCTNTAENMQRRARERETGPDGGGAGPGSADQSERAAIRCCGRPLLSASGTTFTHFVGAVPAAAGGQKSRFQGSNGTNLSSKRPLTGSDLGLRERVLGTTEIQFSSRFPSLLRPTRTGRHHAALTVSSSRCARASEVLLRDGRLM